MPTSILRITKHTEMKSYFGFGDPNTSSKCHPGLYTLPWKIYTLVALCDLMIPGVSTPLVLRRLHFMGSPQLSNSPSAASGKPGTETGYMVPPSAPGACFLPRRSFLICWAEWGMHTFLPKPSVYLLLDTLYICNIAYISSKIFMDPGVECSRLLDSSYVRPEHC